MTLFVFFALVTEKLTATLKYPGLFESACILT